eukprot:SAG31_NODE_36328_length_314_cov_0.953488_2_plen_32_part_01
MLCRILGDVALRTAVKRGGHARDEARDAFFDC